MKLRLALLTTVALLLLPRAAVADQNWKTSSAYWKVMDACTSLFGGFHIDILLHHREALRAAYSFRSFNCAGIEKPSFSGIDHRLLACGIGGGRAL